ncbi:peptidoglycan DD-metalloendopeptidase family protein [Oceanisphaera pacifica]|uniref:M23 family metallopeptidase n=1 Tax=Oceanisphaera pacifica TaxID=2818389 RepID=A0ABS3NCK0_9GAMM|nr:peptidoglycan DD-metalloendopeptidase family protein [Oceanisphaera pacifica]MBO1518319.1 M23 family metallopeptidase [Oceanisphaera pacifica]
MRALPIAMLNLSRPMLSLLWICGGLLGSQYAQADLYRYHDANGMVHYSDNQSYHVKPLPINGQEHRLHRDGVLMRVVKKADGHYLFVLNRLTQPVDLRLRLQAQQNVQVPPQLRQVLRIPATQELFIGKLSPKDEGDWHYDKEFDYHNVANLVENNVENNAQNKAENSAANASTQFDARQISLPDDFVSHINPKPYFSDHPNLASPVKGRYRIAQGFNGDFSHNKPSNRYALDIALPMGTPLYAARSGVVTAAVDTYVGGGLTANYRGKANYLRIRHDDGTMTLYAHLQTGSLRVRKGERVKVGQRVAASGNTGYSSGPHLHLALQMINAGRKESIPFTLQGSQPKTGLWLASSAMGDP